MDRIRASVDRLTPPQRAVLIGLMILVVATAVVLAIVVSGGPAPTTSTTLAAGTTTSTSATSTTEPATTTTSSSTSTTTTTTTVPVPTVEEALVLRPDGLGEFLFGSPADETIAQLALMLGLADDDTGWVDQAAEYGTCIGETVRFVRWHSLQVFFTDGATDWAPAGIRHFAAYVNTGAFEDDSDPLPLVTAEQVGIGTTVGDLRAVYTTGLTVEEDPFLGDYFRVDFPGSGFLIGAVSGIDPPDLVESVAAGLSCGE